MESTRPRLIIGSIKNRSNRHRGKHITIMDEIRTWWVEHWVIGTRNKRTVFLWTGGRCWRHGRCWPI